MEPNKPVMPPQSQVNPVMPTPESSSANNMIWWLVGGLVVIILVVAGIYLYLSNQQTATPSPPPTATTTSSIPDTLDSLEKDVNTINPEVQEDFSSIDQDLGSL